MNASSHRLLWLVLVPWLSTAGACTSMKTVGAPVDDALEEVRVGDTVHIVTDDGLDLVMEVRTLGREALEGEVREVRGTSGKDVRPGQSVRIPRTEINTLQVKRLDGWKTAGFLGGSLAIAYIIGVVMALTLVVIPY